MVKMKESGIQWIGEIPENWECKKTKYCFKNIKEIAGVKSFKYERLALTMKGVIKRSKEDNDGLQPENFDTYQIVRKKDIVFKLIDLQNISTSRVGLSNFDGIVSPAYIRLKAVKDINPYYAEKFYNMLWKNNIFNFLGDAGVRSSLNSKDLLNMEIIVPPLEEQNKIAKFLDKKCEIIDLSISDIENQIETLEQFKHSIITESVTRGLNKNVSLKDSGIKWANKIPINWKVMPNKYVMKKIKNICDIYNNEDILSLTINGVKIRDLDAGGKMPASFNGYQFLYPGNLLMCLFDYDVTPRCIGYINNYGITSPAYSQFILNNGNSSKYYYYYYLMLDNTKELLHLSKNLRYSFTEEELGRIYVIVPPLDEQNQIANYLDLKCGEIDKIIVGKREEIDTLNEYKKSLIFEYVTGKKEVPNE